MSEVAINFWKAGRDDLAAIVSLLADDDIGQSREVVSEPPDVRYVDAFDAINRDENQLLVVAEESNVVVGCLQLTFIPGLPIKPAYYKIDVEFPDGEAPRVVGLS